MKRTPLRLRQLPDYCRGEELMNFITHTAGGGIALVLGALAIIKSALSGSSTAIVASSVYCFGMVAVYAISSVYHGLPKGTAKKVMQIIDHCTIYALIAGSYTPVMLCAMAPRYPVLGWGMLIFQWTLSTLAITFTAIDLKKYNVFSMICYIGLGWGIAPFLGQAWQVLGSGGFFWLLSGGIAYTIGAVLYGLGGKRPWMHAIFHLFVVLGTVLQWVCIFFYVL